jgi:hypothetical protein
VIRQASWMALFAAAIASTPLASNAQQPSTKPDVQARTLSSPNGRYVFGRLGDIRQDTFMLDTQTGRLWLLTTSETLNGRLVLDPVLYVNIDSNEYTLLPKPANAATTFEKVPEPTAAERRLKDLE